MKPKTLKLRQLLIEYPFPPVTLPERMIWTSSSLKLFRRCKRKWFWKYILRLRQKYQDKHLMIGKAFHSAMGEWYNGKRSSMQEIIKRHVTALREESTQNAGYYDQEDFDKLTSMIECFAGMMMGYEEIYAADRKDWNILRNSIEAQFKINMGDFDFAGKIDLVTQERQGKVHKLVEHKTTYKIGDAYVDRLPLDTQIRGYIFGASHPQGLGLNVNRVLYDVIQKCRLRRKSNEDQDSFNRRIADDYISRPDFYFYREDLMFNKADIEAFEYELRQSHSEYMGIVKRAKTPEDWMKELMPNGVPDVMDPWSWATDDGECNAFFRLCPYHALCTTGLDRGTGAGYVQCDDLNEELAETDSE